MSEIPLSFKTFDSTANKASDQEAGRSRAIWDSRSSLFGRTRGRLPEVSLCCVPSFSVQFGAISINNTLFLYFAQQSRKYWHWRKSLLPWKKSIESPEHLISLLKNTWFWPQTGLTCCWTWRSDIHHPEFTISDISSWRIRMNGPSLLVQAVRTEEIHLLIVYSLDVNSRDCWTVFFFPGDC